MQLSQATAQRRPSGPRQGRGQGPRQRQDQDERPSIYSPCQMTREVALPITAIGGQLHQTLETTLSRQLGGRCIAEGYVKPNSVKLLTYSSGLVKSDLVLFHTVIRCDVCFLVADTLLSCVATNITKAGIRAESSDEQPSPFVLFVARDHFYDSDKFNAIEEGMRFTARVIAQRIELNDRHVSVIAEIV